MGRFASCVQVTCSRGRFFGVVTAAWLVSLSSLSSAGAAVETITLPAAADTYLRSGAPDTNEGASSFLRVRASGDNRALMRFDQSQLEELVGSGTVVSAALELEISENGDNWGSAGRTISVFRLTSSWAEGNGFVDHGSPPDRGSGQGGTWACAADAQIANQAKDCSGPSEWEMGMPNHPELHPWVEPASASVLITNGLSGTVAFDVTADVHAFLSGAAANDGWIVKKDQEGAAGLVQFFARETGDGPRLVVVVDRPEGPPSVDVVAPASGAEVTGIVDVTVEASAPAGVSRLEVWIGEELAEAITYTAPLAPTLTRTVAVDLGAGPFGVVSVAAVVVDGLQQVAADADTLITVDGELPVEGPSTGLVLETPTVLSELEPILRQSGLDVIEFFHERPSPGSIGPPPGLEELLAEDGVAFDQELGPVSGGYYGRGLSLDEQVDSYTAAYEAKVPGEEPLVFGLRVEGHLTVAQLGPLGPLVSESVHVGPGQSFSAAGLASSGPEAAVPSRPVISGTRGLSGATPRPPFWPTYGSFSTTEIVRSVPRDCFVLGLIVPCPFLTQQQRRAEFFHTMLWTPAAVAGFDSGQWAYEHDFKTFGSRSGTKPFCSPIGRNSFYVTRRGIGWETNFPKRAAPYFDTDINDPCNTEDLTIGVALPEKLNDDLPAGSNVTAWIEISAVRGDPTTGRFRLAPQSLKRDTSLDCDVFTVSDYFRKFCIGRDTTETMDARVVDSDAGPHAGTQLPVCFNWKWLPVGSSSDGPSRFLTRSCAGEE